MKPLDDISHLVDPDLVQAFTAIQVPPAPLDLATRRNLGRQINQMIRKVLPPPADLRKIDLLVPGLEQGHQVPIRIFAPSRQRTDAVLLWMHGGGFAVGHHEDEDLVTGPWIEATGCTVVSVGYRKAPEHQAPCALDDCYAALKWIATAPAELGVHPRRIAVGGISAGGALAAGVALRARDEQGPPLCFQLLLIPCTDNRSATPSMKTLADPRQWNIHANILAWEMYAGGAGEVPLYTAPLRMDDLSRLPPAYVEISGADPLRDEGIEYAQKMMQAGVPTELQVFPGACHGSSYFQPMAPVSIRARTAVLEAVKRALTS